MKKNTPLKSIMSTNVISAHMKMPLSEIKAILSDNDFHHIPIVDGTQLIGMLSSTDILKLTSGMENMDERALNTILDHSSTVKEAMTKNLVTLKDDQMIRDAAEVLSHGKFHAVPVVKDSNLVGMVTSTDLIKYLSAQF